MFLHLYSFPVILSLRTEKTPRNKGLRRLFITGVCLSAWLVAPQGVLTKHCRVQILLPTPTQSAGHCTLRLFYHLHPQTFWTSPPPFISGPIRDVSKGSIKIGRLIALGSHWSSYVLNIMSIIHHSEISLQGKITLRGARKTRGYKFQPQPVTVLEFSASSSVVVSLEGWSLRLSFRSRDSTFQRWKRADISVDTMLLSFLWVLPSPRVGCLKNAIFS